MSKCMECSKPPTHECVWAEGRGRAWFCDKHWKSWSKEHEGDIVKHREVEGGQVGKKYGEDPAKPKKKADSQDGKKTGDRTGVGFFIPVPKELAGQFPPLGDEDKSKPHATFLYVGNVPADQEEAFLNASREAFAEIREPVRAHLQGPEYFVHPDKGRRVALMGIRYSHDMAGIRWKLRDKLIDAGLRVDDKFPLIYRPHVTLAYLDGLTAVYKGDVPQGDWEFDNIEVWGLPKLQTIPFGSATANRVASTHLSEMTDQASRALMKFLSDVARKLGVAKDTYVVGGAVRNFVINQPIKDIDVVIDSIAAGRDSEWFAKKLQRAIPVPTNLTTNNYGVAILTIKGDWEVGGANLDGEVIEIANARKESYGGQAGKGYKPHMVEPSTIEEDVIRREFTFNTLMWRLLDLAKGPDKAEIIDLTGCGLRDLQEGVARCPQNPDKVFADDPSRMVRAIKFLLKYGLKIAPDVEASIKRNRQKLQNVPPSHLSNMIIDTFYEGGVGKKALLEMKRLGLLDVVKDIARKDKGFASALGNWAEKKADLATLFDLMDLGMPTGKRLGFLDARQRQRVREITVQMSADESDAFVAVLAQPGKVMDMRALASEFGLTGKEFQKITEAARQALLIDPVLAANPRRLEKKVRQALGGGRTGALRGQPEFIVMFDDASEWGRTKMALRGAPEAHPEWMVWLGTPIQDQHTHYLMDVKDDAFVHFTTNRRARLILADGKLKMRPPYKKFGTDNVTAVSSRWGHFVPRVQTTHIKPEMGEKLVAITFQTPTVPKYGYPEEVVWNRDVVLKNAKMIPFEKGVSMLKKTPHRLNVRDEDDIVYYQVPSEVQGGKIAATFKLNIGDSVLYGKYKNKKGKIKGFKTDSKGDVVVTVEPYPKGRKQNKELKLFKIRPAPEPWPEEKQASAERVALRYQKQATLTTPADLANSYQELMGLWKALKDVLRQVPPEALQNRHIKRQLKNPWGWLVVHGRNVAQGVLDLKHVPAKKHKGLELAARHFMSARRMPIKFGPWMEKTQRHIDFLNATQHWRDKVEGTEEKFKLGPFMVHNTMGLTGKKLENVKKTINKAAKLIRAAKVPATLKKTLYGDVFIVPQLQQAKTMAWYNGKRDDMYIRPFARFNMDVVHNIIHELSHRWWQKFGDKKAQREWEMHHIRVGQKTPEIEMPGVGDELPIRMRRIKGPFFVEKMDDQNYWFQVPNQDRVLPIPIHEIRKVLLRSARANKNYPTPYSSTHPQEHFCDASALAVMKKLPEEHLEDFERIWGSGGDEDKPKPKPRKKPRKRPRKKRAAANVKYTELKLDDEDGKEIGSWVIPEDSVPLLISDAPLVENVADRFASRMAADGEAFEEGERAVFGPMTGEPEYVWAEVLETTDECVGDIEIESPYGEESTDCDNVTPYERWRELHPNATPAERVAAKYQKKKEVPKADGKGTTTVYEYSEGQVQHRNREKAKRVEKLRGKLGDLQKKVKKDLSSDDLKTRLTALAVGLINDTYERVGNPDSAKEGHFGVTGWQAKHVTVGKDKATIKYVGKSGVSQKKETRDPDIVRVLREAVKDKSGTDPVFEVDDVKVDSTTVNDYLKPMDITAKDIRGLHANRVMQNKLKAIRNKGNPAPDDKKEREKKFKEEFKKALEETAKEVGHEPSTLKSQYLVPGLEDTFLATGQVKTKLDKQAAGGGFAEVIEIIDRYRQEFEDILTAGSPKLVWRIPRGSDPWDLAQRVGIRVLSHQDWVAGYEVDGQLVAALFDSSDSGDRECYEFDIVVDPAWQRKALGSKLMDIAISNYDDLTDPFPDIKFCLDAVNPHAVRMLKQRGFVETGKGPGHTYMTRRATKTHAEKEDEAVEDLVKPAPKFKPPRKDLKKKRVDMGDEDTEGGTADTDEDLSLNYKRVAMRWLDRLAGKVPEDSKDKKPGDYWQKENGEWGLRLPDGEYSHAKNEANAAAMAAGKLDPDDADERNAEKGKGDEEVSLSLAEKSKALSDAEKAKGEPLTPDEKTEVEEETLAQKAQRLEEEAEQRKAEAEKKKLQADIDKIDNVARQVGDTNFAAELKGVESDEDKRAILMAYADELEKLKTGVFSGDALSDKTIAEATKALKKDTFGQGMNLRDSAKALAAKTLARKVVSNPTLVGGTKVNDQPKDADALRQRTEQAFQEYSKMTPELRGAAIAQMEKLLEDTDDENKFAELQNIANGLAMAALVNDEKISPLREEPADEMKALVKALHKKGEAMKLVGMSTDEFHSPAGRELVQGVMSEVSDDELYSLVGGENGPYKDMIKVIKEKASSDEDEDKQSAKVLTDMLKDLHLDGMTTIHAFLTETARKGENGTDDQDEVDEKVKSAQGALRNDKRFAQIQKELMKCLADAEGDPEKINKCNEVSNKARVQQVEIAQDIAREIIGEPAPDSLTGAQIRDTVEEQDIGNLDKKYKSQGKEAQSFASSPKVFQSSFYTWNLISEGQVCAQAELPRMELGGGTRR